ncbi:MAG: YlxR family protein [Candidatus Rokubacteria bacterium]|nr:YlxR family protein [Candidatus Rokubacteria bacterium]MBI4594338.1 YlxR family protein [Candidatus Rokubacteria bacterium]
MTVGRRNGTRGAVRTARRTCIGCRQVRPKEELVRLGRGATGVVKPDGEGRGRGAYVCADPQCVERALKTGRLAQAFRKPSVGGEKLFEEVRESWQRQR